MDVLTCVTIKILVGRARYGAISLLFCVCETFLHCLLSSRLDQNHDLAITHALAVRDVSL